mmetsp:Transcript_20216/g.55821  ORF Transcript_20216/g.55821 Transcript_20216/m.55821 type:complete len:352 (+) Transcript_20216:164-1219(+)|eukprot:CAMPEP_0168723268 /NCGR_PEP_ID=MMETSP0724-20121128/3028_1 /TAXON_ID=265536 /ORGANISM="Amphiprora sp., Strain CCMP467" /LENGTH=351 /DNA_ID=CAMNT_0008769971 /DNA_START=79 /DNA_END=1134 /DNA_ORIENTATION=-
MATLDDIRRMLKETLQETLQETLGVGRDDTLNLPQMQFDIAQMQSDIAQVQSDIAALPQMQSDIALLVSMNPDAALRKIQPVLVGQGSAAEGFAVRDGPLSTWTYMKAGDRRMAVGAGHCVVDSRIKRSRLSQDVQGLLQDLEFVEIPKELKDRVTHVGLCKNYMKVANQKNDIALLLLDRFPNGVDEARAIEWMSFDGIPRDPYVNAKVGGLSLSGSVRGHGCYIGEHTIRFVEDSGEGGQSGRLIFNLTPPEGMQPFTIGVYNGCRRGSDLKRRGVVVKLPPLRAMRLYPKQDSPLQSSHELALKKRGSGSRTKYFRSDDGFKFKNEDEKLYGFFVHKTYTRWNALSTT